MTDLVQKLAVALDRCIAAAALLIQQAERISELELQPAFAQLASDLAENLAATEAERDQYIGEANVMREILRECYNVIYSIDPEDSDEAEQLRHVLKSIDRATSPQEGSLI